jgi:hypothetical protein
MVMLVIKYDAGISSTIDNTRFLIGDGSNYLGLNDSVTPEPDYPLDIEIDFYRNDYYRLIKLDPQIYQKVNFLKLYFSAASRNRSTPLIPKVQFGTQFHKILAQEGPHGLCE